MRGYFNPSYPATNILLSPPPNWLPKATIRPKRVGAGQPRAELAPALRSLETTYDVQLPWGYSRWFPANGGLMPRLAEYAITWRNAALAMDRRAPGIELDLARLGPLNEHARQGDWEELFPGGVWPNHLIVIGDADGGQYAVEAGVGDDDPPVLLVTHDPPEVLIAAPSMHWFVEQQFTVAAVCAYNALITCQDDQRAALARKLQRQGE